ncbi:MAG: hypothetical protein H6732_02905 [Alphaproteobacteria bacterium]|nr:hypothetical protein [Alphaproteobacteria bacterium]
MSSSHPAPTPVTTRSWRVLAPAAALLALGLSAPAPALADTLAITPLLPLKNVKPERIADLFSLMSSELEFMQGVDEVVEIDPVPPSLRTSCLTSSSCLSGIAKGARADRLLTGTVEQAGELLTVDLLLFDVAAGKTLRRKTYGVSADPASLVDEITPILVETVTGEAPRRRDEQPMAGLDFEADEFGDDAVVVAGPTVVAAPPAPPPEALRSGSARAVDRQIVAPPPPEPEPETPPAEFDPSMFSFESDASDISYGGGTAEAAPAPAPAPAPPPTRFWEEEDDFEEEDAVASADLDEPAPRSTRSSTTKKNDDPHRWRRVHIPVRGAYANYSIFHFAGVGGELQVRTVNGLFITAGVSALFVSRCVETVSELNQVDNPACGADGLTVQTSTLVPINLGLLYRFKEGRFQPYLGVDGNLAVIEPATGGLTLGARLRGGFDIFFARNFGLNLDVALGFWTGQAWPRIDPRVQTIGFQPSIGGGLVIAF